MSNHNSKNKRESSSRVFRILILGIVLIFGITILAMNIGVEKSVFKEYGDYLKRQLGSRETMLVSELAQARSKTQFLYSTPPIKGVVRALKNDGIDPYDNTTVDQWIERLETIFVAFLENNQDINQARFIGDANDGQELLKVERKNGNINIVEKNALQKKGGMGYFIETKKRLSNSIYVSDIELNREYGQIEFPYWPTFRVSIPVFDEHKQFFGIVILNINAQYLLDKLQQELSPGVHLFLLNNQGNFILHPNKDYNFGFELGRNDRWSTLFTNQKTSAIETQGSGLQVAIDKASGENLYYLRDDIQLSAGNSRNHITAVLALPQSTLDLTLRERRQTSTLILIGIFIIAITVILFYQHLLNNKQAMINAQSKYQAIIEGSLDAIIVLDDQGDITSWNSGAKTVLGFFENQALGQDFFKLISIPRASGINHIALRAVMRGEKIDPVEVVVLMSNGQPLDVAVTFSPLNSQDATKTGVTAIVRDISRQKEMERKIQYINHSLEEQVEERTLELKVARNEAMDANRAKGEFLANMSHEIRTPMNGVFGMINLLRREPLNDKQKGYLDMAEGSVTALTSLINDILDFSKIEAGKLDIEQADFNLLSVVHATATSMSIGAQDKSLEFILDLSHIRHNYVVGDANRLRQILFNLISNAIKFTDNGYIEVCAQTEEIDGGDIVLTCCVTDTGVGISDAMKPRMFEVFSQESSSVARQYGGTGLGLSISRQLCQLMRGGIAVESESGKGSKFTFSLTLKLGEGKGIPMVDLAGKQFTVVDTHPKTVVAIRNILEAWGGKVVDFKGIKALLANGPAIKIDRLFVEDLIYIENRELIGDFLRSNSETEIIVACNHLSTHGEEIGDDFDGRLVTMDKPVSPVNLYPILAGHSSTETDLGSGVDTSVIENLKGACVLVVDDHRINREVAAGLLQSYDIKVVHAVDGSVALECLRTNTDIALVILDCQMPVMDGFATAKNIREGAGGPHHKNIPIIAMTAGAMAGDREKCLQAGMNDYLTKPIDADSFSKKIAFWLRSSSSATSISKEAGAGDGAIAVTSTVLNESSSGEMIWDRDGALRRINNKESLFREVIAIYVETTPATIDEMEEAISANQLDSLRKLAHQMKGISANVGAVAVSETCKYLEETCHNTNFDASNRYWKILKQDYEDVIYLFKEYLLMKG
ncbi:MAG: ATP-binding protein [Porticoccus sp.]|nr:ATP-binding protein [Porticoccus sp.]